jgi:crossover junction endodeoxyribonuclease RusA
MSLPSLADPPFACPPDVVIALPVPPTTNNMFFNSARAGRVKTPEYRAWIKEAGYILASQRPPQVLGKVSLLIEVAEPETKRRQDIGNREKAVTDLLVSHRIIEGDDQRFVREITMRWAAVDGVRVTVRPCA